MKLHEQQTKNDQITGGLSEEGIAHRSRGLAQLRFAFFQKGFHPASTSNHPYSATVLQHRLSRNHPTATRLSQLTTNPQTQKGTSLFHLVLCRKTPCKKRAFDQVLAVICQQAHQNGLIEEKPEACIDATGMETRHASQYFVYRAGYQPFRRHRFTKLTLVCHSQTHLLLSAVVSDGPSQDSPQFPQAVRQACRHVSLDRLLADAGYDGEHNHRLAREELGVRSTVIALNKRCTGRKWPKTKYRRQMKKRFHCRKYNQRWQVESAISRHKRLLGPELHARTTDSQERECYVRVMTHDLMILRLAA